MCLKEIGRRIGSLSKGSGLEKLHIRKGVCPNTIGMIPPALLNEVNIKPWHNV